MKYCILFFVCNLLISYLIIDTLPVKLSTTIVFYKGLWFCWVTERIYNKKLTLRRTIKEIVKVWGIHYEHLLIRVMKKVAFLNSKKDFGK